jgi:hypothetical protein
MSQYATARNLAQLGLPANVLEEFAALGANTPVVSSGTTPPAVSVAGAPDDDFAGVVQILSGGTLGAATFRYSLDGGTTWSATLTTVASYAMAYPGSSTPTGLTLQFPTGTYNADNRYTWTSSAPDVDAVLAAQSAIADGYIAASGKKLPLASWGDDLRQAVAKMAAYEILSVLGHNPETPGNALWRDRYLDAMGWLKDIQAGRASNVNMVETSPVGTLLDRIETVSEGQRGW